MQLDRDEIRIEHILDAIAKLQIWFKAVDKSVFNKKNNEMLFDAALMKLVFIGELCSKVDKEIQKDHPEIPWRQLKDLRNFIAHEYLGVDESQVYVVATQELPSLKAKFEHLLRKLRGESHESKKS